MDYTIAWIGFIIRFMRDLYAGQRLTPEAEAVLDILKQGGYWSELATASLGVRLVSGIKVPENWIEAIEAKDDMAYGSKGASAVCMAVVTLGRFIKAGGLN